MKTKLYILIIILFCGIKSFGFSLREEQSRVSQFIEKLETRHQKLISFTTYKKPIRPNFFKDTFGALDLKKWINGELHADNIYGGFNCEYDDFNFWKFGDENSDIYLYEQGLKLFQDQKFCEAAKHFKSIVEVHKGSPHKLDSWYLMMESYFQTQDFAKVINTANIFISEILPTYKSMIPSDQINDLKEYAHYLIVRSSFHANTGIGMDPEFINYTLGIHREQTHNKDPLMMRLDLHSYLGKYSNEERAEHAHQMLTQAINILVGNEIHVALTYMPQAKIFKDNSGVAYLLESKEWKSERSYTLYMASARRLTRALALANYYKNKDSLELPITDEILRHLKDCYDQLFSLAQNITLTDLNIKLGLEILLNPYQGLSFVKHKVDSNTLELITQEVQRAQRLQQKPHLNLEIPWEKWYNPLNPLKISDLQNMNPSRVFVALEHSKKKQEEIDWNLIQRDYGSIENFKNSYYYKKFQTYPLSLECTVGLETNSFEINEFGEKVTLYPDKIEAKCPMKPGAMEMKYTRLRVWDQDSPMQFKISYLWEDKDSLILNREEAIKYLLKGLEMQTQQLDKLITSN